MKIRFEYIFITLFMLLAAAACAPTADKAEGNEPITTEVSEQSVDENPLWRIRVIDPAGEAVLDFTEAELRDLLQSADSVPTEMREPFTHVYSTINNWPTSSFYATEGYSVASVLMAAGLYETAQTVTFRGEDGYEVSFTREQLLDPQYFYPNVGENEEGSEPVFPVIAYRWREGTDDLSSIRDENASLIIGQRNPFEHTNPAFVEDLSEIIVSDIPAESWPAATIFPESVKIALGEKVKLQHPDYGLVKLHYTLDGTEPTMLSPMYNPSTYQQELNVPITITGPTVIKVMVCGYGKADSEIAVFEIVAD